MQLLHAGTHQFLLLELESDLLKQGAAEMGFGCEVEDHGRIVTLDLDAPERESPLLLFDASDPGNTGWFSRCQFYVDGRTGTVLQTPFLLANRKERGGRASKKSVRLQIRKELPVHFKLPGRQPVNEKTTYSVLFNFLNALQNVGVGLCGGTLLAPLAGRADAPSASPLPRG